MNYNDICHNVTDVYGDTYAEMEEDVYVVFLPFGEKGECYTAYEIFKAEVSSEIAVFVRRIPTRFPFFPNRKIFKLSHIWMDKTLPIGVENGHKIFYAYPSYNITIGSGGGVGALHGDDIMTIYSVIPVNKETFKNNPLPRLREILNKFIPSVVSVEKITKILKAKVEIEDQFSNYPAPNFKQARGSRPDALRVPENANFIPEPVAAEDILNQGFVQEDEVGSDVGSFEEENES